MYSVARLSGAKIGMCALSIAPQKSGNHTATNPFTISCMLLRVTVLCSRRCLVALHTWMHAPTVDFPTALTSSHPMVQVSKGGSTLASPLSRQLSFWCCQRAGKNWAHRYRKVAFYIQKFCSLSYDAIPPVSALHCVELLHECQQQSGIFPPTISISIQLLCPDISASASSQPPW